MMQSEKIYTQYKNTTKKLHNAVAAVDFVQVKKSKVKSNYFIVRPKVDQRTGLLSLPHLGNFRRTHAHHICLYFVSIHQRATTGAQRCALLVRLLTTHLPTPEGWKAELA